MDFNLAPFKYRNILSSQGGPIAKIIASQIGTQKKPQYEAVAFLVPTLVPDWHRKSALYCEGHGGGTHSMQNVACHMAISEALERWAFLETLYSRQAAEYGFEIEPSTSGMAAFPGLTTKPAQTRADWEAVERWALLEWWGGRLSASLSPGSSRLAGFLYPSLPFKDRDAVIVWNTLPAVGTVYGFAAADNRESAEGKALIEQARNNVVLSRFYSDAKISKGSFISDESQTIYDRRLVFFSTQAGNKIFWDKVRSSTTEHITPPNPQKIVDREIPGPWNRYTTVWRVLYAQHPDIEISKPQHDIFVF